MVFNVTEPKLYGKEILSLNDEELCLKSKEFENLDP